jgi:DNA-binding GntR family transcriptional regulator
MSLAEYEQELFLLDSLELPAVELVAERASEEDKARWDAKVAEIRRLSRVRDRLESRSHVSALHEDIFSVSHYPRLVGIIASIQMLQFRYSVLFVDRDPSKKPREHELELVTMRVRHPRNRDAAAAAEVVRRRHAEQFKRAKARVAARGSHGGELYGGGAVTACAVTATCFITVTTTLAEGCRVHVGHDGVTSR